MCVRPNVIYKLYEKSEKTHFHPFDSIFIDELKMKNIKYQLVPCGQCLECRLSNAKQWTSRLMNEYELSDFTIFLTLTYNDLSLARKRDFREDISDFVKIIRENIRNKYNKKIKFFSCFELGDESLRPHHHLIIFNFPKDLITNQINEVDYQSDFIDKYWSFGFNTIQCEPNYNQFRYVAGYVQKKLKNDIKFYNDHNLPVPFMICSKGLGLEWLKNNKDKLDTNELFLIKNDKVIKSSLPRYYVNKLENENSKLFKEIKDTSERLGNVYSKGISKMPYNCQILYFKNKESKCEHTNKLLLRNKI